MYQIKTDSHFIPANELQQGRNLLSWEQDMRIYSFCWKAKLSEITPLLFQMHSSTLVGNNCPDNCLCLQMNHYTRICAAANIRLPAISPSRFTLVDGVIGIPQPLHKLNQYHSSTVSRHQILLLPGLVLYFLSPEFRIRISIQPKQQRPRKSRDFQMCNKKLQVQITKQQEATRWYKHTGDKQIVCYEYEKCMEGQGFSEASQDKGKMHQIKGGEVSEPRFRCCISEGCRIREFGI